MRIIDFVIVTYDCMKKLFIVANWKSNLTSLEVKDWFRGISNIPHEKEIVVCPPFTLLTFVKELIVNSQLSIAIGVQNISPFDEGAYTGEVNGKQIKEFADYVLIGHSERRTNFFENNNILANKILMAKKYGLEPLFFIQNETTFIPGNISIVVYEPPSSISPGIPDTPANANIVASHIKEKGLARYVLYGGNVTSENVKSFTQMPNIDGVLVGRASLDPLEFSKIIKNA